MRVRRLEIHGFKTFADRTILELTSGITAVVGPNGSGKSNIADAVAWVLGEQNVRNIRGSKSQDVIFSGSQKRKALGLAEVSLTLDNSSGRLPLDYSEITVTRRLYRSGESEYLINKTPCRLKDIVELFLDTGMGREAYSIIGQGEIDALLSARPEDRRSLFEEAAGIKKYQFRRKEATRRLENTEANLRRVNDIIAELSSQIEPLAEQAKLAEEYNELVSRLREIETGLLINDLRRWSEELERVRESKSVCAASIVECDEKIAAFEQEKEKIAELLKSLDKEIEEAHAGCSAASDAVQRTKSRLALLEERETSVSASVKRIASEIEQIENRIFEAEERLVRMKSEALGCSEREAKLAEDVDERSKSLEAIALEIESAARIVEDSKSVYLEFAREQASKRAELEALQVRIAELRSAEAKYSAEADALRNSLADKEKQAAEVRAELEEISLRIKDRKSRLSDAVKHRDQVQNALSELSRRLDKIERVYAEKSSRLDTLRELAEAYEGFFEGVRAVMSANKKGVLKGDYAVVADVISVPKGLETAVECALGSSVQDIISDTTDAAKEAIRFLRENRAGRATFLPLDGLRPSSGRVSDLNTQGVVGLGSELVSFDSRYEKAVQVLLGRAVIVDGIDNAVAYSRKASGWLRVVTLEGEVIVPTGAISGGVRSGRASNLLARRQEIDSLEEELSCLKSERGEVEKEMQSAEADLKRAEHEIEALEKADADDRLAMVETERQASFTEQEYGRIKAEIEVVSAELEDVILSIKNDLASAETLSAELSDYGVENTSLDDLVAEAQSKLDKLTKERAALNEELMELSVTLAAVRERRAGFEQSIMQLESSISDMKLRRAAGMEEMERQTAASAANSGERDELVQKLSSEESYLADAQNRLNILTEKRAEVSVRYSTIDSELKSLNHRRSEASESIRSCDVKEARLEVQIAQAAERLQEEYGMSAEEALARSEPAEVERGTAAEVARLRREIRAMGIVNTGAVQEYQRISERYEFLVSQRADLEDARAKLQEGISEIDKSTRDLFMGTFRSVSEYFDIMFKRLFGGGSTELTLTDPSNLTETGIEVIVQIPGKRLQNMTLLSGGERALTAVALLFALLMARPSPFVLLDEVDAPLDDANIERFADVLREFSHNTQFIVITHNRATMEAADTLYGVTMEEPGVSKLISVRLADESERRRIGSEVTASDSEPVSVS